MAHIASTDKLPTDADQFYFQSGGYVLLRIVRDGDEFSVLTATASEDRPYRPAHPRPQVSKPIFTDPDGTPFRPKQDREPPAVHPKAYPDKERLIEAAEKTLHLGQVEPRADQWGRPYLAYHGITDAASIRRAGNRLAEELGFEIDPRPWAAEEMQSIYEEFSIDDSGDDVYLGDGVSISSSGKLV